MRPIKNALQILFASGLSLPSGIERVEKEVTDGGEDVQHLLQFVRGSKRGIIRGEIPPEEE